MSDVSDLRERLIHAKKSIEAALELLGVDPTSGPTCSTYITDPWGRELRCLAPAVERKGGVAWCAEHRPK